jgi:hypothetical protein
MTEDILSIKFKSRDLEREVTIKEYFIALLEALWNEKEGFDGKRPFGYSGWEYEIYRVLVKNNLIPGKLHEDGGIKEYDRKTADEFVLNNIIRKI